MPRGASRCGLSPICLPSLPFPGKEMFGLKQKRCECRVGRPKADKRRKWKRFHVEFTNTKHHTPQEQRTAILINTDKKKMIEGNAPF
jgi:hypothetical protein